MAVLGPPPLQSDTAKTVVAEKVKEKGEAIVQLSYSDYYKTWIETATSKESHNQRLRRKMIVNASGLRESLMNRLA